MYYYVFTLDGNQKSWYLLGTLKHKDDAERVMNAYSQAYITHQGEIIAHKGDAMEKVHATDS